MVTLIVILSVVLIANADWAGTSELQRAGSPLRPECSRGTWPVGHGGQLRRMRIRNSGISAISMCAGDRRADVSDRKIRARPRPHAPPGGAIPARPTLVYLLVYLYAGSGALSLRVLGLG